MMQDFYEIIRGQEDINSLSDSLLSLETALSIFVTKGVIDKGDKATVENVLGETITIESGVEDQKSFLDKIIMAIKKLFEIIKKALLQMVDKLIIFFSRFKSKIEDVEETIKENEEAVKDEEKMDAAKEAAKTAKEQEELKIKEKFFKEREARVSLFNYSVLTEPYVEPLLYGDMNENINDYFGKQDYILAFVNTYLAYVKDVSSQVLKNIESGSSKYLSFSQVNNTIVNTYPRYLGNYATTNVFIEKMKKIFKEKTPIIILKEKSYNILSLSTSGDPMLLVEERVNAYERFPKSEKCFITCKNVKESLESLKKVDHRKHGEYVRKAMDILDKTLSENMKYASSVFMKNIQTNKVTKNSYNRDDYYTTYKKNNPYGEAVNSPVGREGRSYFGRGNNDGQHGRTETNPDPSTNTNALYVINLYNNSIHGNNTNVMIKVINESYVALTKVYVSMTNTITTVVDLYDILTEEASKN